MHSPGPGGIALSMPALTSAVPTGPQPYTASVLACFCLECLCFSNKWVAGSCPGLKADSFLCLASLGVLSVLYSSCRRTGFPSWHGPHPVTHASFSLCHFPLSPLDVGLSPSTFLDLRSSWFFPAHRHFLLQLFHFRRKYLCHLSAPSHCPDVIMYIL